MGSEFTVREFLRDATREQHTSLDLSASSMRLETEQGYAHFLATQASVLIPVERALEDGGIRHLLPDWPERSRADAIQQDMADLHVAVSPIHKPVFTSEAALLGAAYVLEGSRLGARVVLRQSGQRSVTRFLRHGQEDRLWQSFLTVLEGNANIRHHPETAATVARRVFSLFIQSMTTHELAAAE